MFKIIARLCVVLVTLIMVSCQKEVNVDLGTGGSPIGAATLKMKIDGVQWTAGKGSGVSLIAGYTNISGTSVDGKSLSITLNDTIPGTYVLDQQSFSGAGLTDSLDLGGLSYTTNGGNDTSQAGGVVVISSVDKINKTISGTFHFKAFRELDSKQKRITEGVFEKLPYTSTLPTANLTDTFHVKIDNTLTTAKSISGSLSTNSISIAGSNLDLSKLVALSIPSNVTVGTYNLEALTGIYVGIYAPVTTSIMTSLSGKITILEHNTSTRRLRANFNFIAVDLITAKTANLSEGYFSIQYQ